MPLAAFSRHVMLSLSKHLRPFGYAHYHKRSNAETTVAMIKAKFGASVRSKTGRAQVNEVLCKVLCHNFCVLIQSFYELGIEAAFAAPTFEPESEPEPKIIDLNQYRARLGI